MISSKAPILNSGRSATVGKIVRVSSGNFIEMYDFIVYGYYATYIADAFFPLHNRFSSLMLSLMTFGAGYLMRPLGALVLGAYIDRHGRRRGLMLTLLLMALGTLSMAVTPGYASIGVLAPLIVLGGRLLQGVSAGVELGGVSVYLLEIASEGKRGFYTAWQSASQQAAVVFTAVMGIILTQQLSPDQMNAWGWRVPFLLGCFIVPILLWLRSSLEETEAFQRSERTRSAWEKLPHCSAELATHRCGHDARCFDHRHVLSDNGLYADIRQNCASAKSDGRLRCDSLHRSF